MIGAQDELITSSRIRKSTPRPFLKWAGGKTQLLPDLLKRVPTAFGTYHEPFLGGGALFFALYRQGRIQRAVLSDLNRELMDTYQVVRDDVDGVIRCLRAYPYARDVYYSLRDLDPWRLSPAERAARMIYLNRTGYNGLYRVNRKGRFNVPFGRYRNPVICDEENLHAVARALQSVELHCAAFESVLDRARSGDFVYFDPPYQPVSRTASFTAYIKDGFDKRDQERLCAVVQELDRRGVRVLLSNSATDLIRRLYGGYHIEEVAARRSINCVGPRRRDHVELLISNYD